MNMFTTSVFIFLLKMLNAGVLFFYVLTIALLFYKSDNLSAFVLDLGLQYIVGYENLPYISLAGAIFYVTLLLLFYVLIVGFVSVIVSIYLTLNKILQELQRIPEITGRARE